MLFRLLLTVVLVPFVCFPASSGECEKGCQTTNVVLDCSGAAVANAKVQIKLCCGDNQEIESTTNSNGEAKFSYCAKDICGNKIALEGFAVRSFDRNSCSGDGKTSRCEVKVCTR